MLDLKRLRVLREVVSQGSFSAAADSLYLSQSAISQQVATLEREVGMPLLERTRDGTTATAAGRALVTHADAAIARLEEAERELQEIAGLEGGEVRVASFPSASATLLTMAVREFTSRYPKVRLTADDSEPEDSLPRLRSGKIDLAVVFDYPAVPTPEDRDFERTLLLTESMYVALPADHPLASQKRVRIADLSDEQWLSGSCPSSCGVMVRQVCRDAGFEPSVGLHTDDYSVMQGFIAAGLGVTLLPDLALPTLRDDLVVREAQPAAPKRQVWAVSRRTHSHATEAMTAALVKAGEDFAVKDVVLQAAA
ncbi:MAG: LysR family transcriptional regulator [Actinomycetota bacterium]|nr:LysR family transcriptional regulator [Actinomycetota bacterium]